MNDQRATVRGIAETTEAALAKALGVLPAYAEVVEKNEIVAPASKTLALEAADENRARTQAQSQAVSEYGPGATVEVLALAEAGRKGFLGLGAKPDRYEVVIARKAVVEIVYRIVPPDVQALQAAGDVEGLLQALNYRAAILFTSPMGYELYRRLGFETQFHQSLYVWNPTTVS